MIIPNLVRYGRPLLSPKAQSSRPFFQWLSVIFNKIDVTRAQEFGPDRVCAEWCLRNGAAIQWVGSDKMLDNYNNLPPEGTRFYIHKIDATDSSISHYGFIALRGCEHIKEIVLKNCDYIENDALKLLSFVKNSLEYLQVAQCGNITDDGLLHLKDLKNLKTLELCELSYVVNKMKTLQELKSHLPNCDILHDFEKK